MCTYCIHGCTACDKRGHSHSGKIGPCERCARIMEAQEGHPPTYDPEMDPNAAPLPEERRG